MTQSNPVTSKSVADDRYPRELLLPILADEWRRFSEQTCDIFEETRIDHLFKQIKGGDEIDLWDYVKECADALGVRLERGDPDKCFGRCDSINDPIVWEAQVGRNMTFGRLADFLRERIEPVCVRTRHLLGRPCRAAGAFDALRMVAQSLAPEAERIAPSTPIPTVFRGGRAIRRFWNRVCLLSDGSLARLPAKKPVSTWSGLVVFALCLVVPVGCFRAGLGWGASLGAGFGTFLLLLFVIEAIRDYFDRPLPASVCTFKDLARELAR